MAHSSWGPGFPNCQSNKIKGLVRSDGLKIQLRHELLRLFSLLIDETERMGYNVRRFNEAGAIVTGGFNCRPIADTNTPSNHSWGLAIDINSDKNPRQKPLTTDIPVAVRDLWTRFGFRWGGTFPTPDPMHFEYMGSVSDAQRDSARAQGDLGGAQPGGVGPPFPGILKRRQSSGPDVCTLQARLRQLGHSIDSIANCPFGPQTESAVKAFQRSRNLPDNGVVDRSTWNALFAG
jgi:hypothetical protein